MAKQKIYAIGATIQIARFPIWMYKKTTIHTAILPQLEITKELLTPAITTKMSFYPDLNVALKQAEADGEDYEKDQYHFFPPVFLVEIEDIENNQFFRVTNILKAYVIKTKKAALTEVEINLSAMHALEINKNKDSQIICTNKNYFDDFSKLQLNKQRWTLCNIHFFGTTEGRGGANNLVASLPKELLQKICEDLTLLPLKLGH